MTTELAGQIAYNYQKNGFKHKGQTLRDSGYSESYSKQAGLGLFNNVLVKEAIQRLQTINRLNITLTADEVMEDLKYGLDLAKKRGDLAAIARFAELRGKTLALFKDKTITEEDTDTPTPEEAEEISKERRESIKLQTKTA